MLQNKKFQHTALENDASQRDRQWYLLSSIQRSRGIIPVLFCIDLLVFYFTATDTRLEHWPRECNSVKINEHWYCWILTSCSSSFYECSHGEGFANQFRSTVLCLYKASLKVLLIKFVIPLTATESSTRWVRYNYFSPMDEYLKALRLCESSISSSLFSSNSKILFLQLHRTTAPKNAEGDQMNANMILFIKKKVHPSADEELCFYVKDWKFSIHQSERMSSVANCCLLQLCVDVWRVIFL